MNEDGTLTYTFVESVKATYPYYVIRLTGGALYWHVVDGVQRCENHRNG